MLKWVIWLSCLCLSACVMNAPVAPPETRAKQVASIATAAGWTVHTIHTPSFTLKSYGPPLPNKSKTLAIYIEGDGLAWASEDMPSDNPTPIVPTGLKMALHDQKNGLVVYLARPCQLVFKEEWGRCHVRYWTNLRFSPEAIIAMGQAIDHLKKFYHAKKIILVGYSGGGTIAALVAARRADVIKLMTVAAVLDVKQWVQQKNLSPLEGSLDPGEEWKGLATVPQAHWAGGQDTVVPKEVAFAFAKHFPAGQKPKVIVVPGFDHACCWATDWAPS